MNGKYAVMEANKMTCEQAKQIDLVDFLNSLGFNPVKISHLICMKKEARWMKLQERSIKASQPFTGTFPEKTN